MHGLPFPQQHLLSLQPLNGAHAPHSLRPYLGLLHQRVDVIQIESPSEPKDHFLKQDLGDRPPEHCPGWGHVWSRRP